MSSWSSNVFFLLLFERSHPSTDWLVTPISDWSVVWIKNTTWADKRIDCDIWYNKPSGTVSELKTEIPQCFGKADVLLHVHILLQQQQQQHTHTHKTRKTLLSQKQSLHQMTLVSGVILGLMHHYHWLWVSQEYFTILSAGFLFYCGNARLKWIIFSSIKNFPANVNETSNEAFIHWCKIWNNRLDNDFKTLIGE